MFHVKLSWEGLIKNLDMRIVDKVVLSLQEKEVLYNFGILNIQRN
jgi:hypothetical protein